jgi:ankyrin repeat protein
MLFSDIFHEKVTEPGWILSLNDTGGTVLHSFAAVGDFYVVQLAFAARAEMIDCLDENGETVLHRCCETGHAEVRKSIQKSHNVPDPLLGGCFFPGKEEGRSAMDHGSVKQRCHGVAPRVLQWAPEGREGAC